jgi:hypothetical protein
MADHISDSIQPGSCQDTQPLGLTNWQLAQRSHVELRNQIGSDVHITAGTLAS